MENIKEIINPYGFIYITTNIINGKKYIGQKMFRERWEHYIGSGVYFLRAVKKYGKENFIREIIAIAYSKEELDQLEIEFINNHDAVNSEDYYNIGCGGNAPMKGRKASEETKKKQSLAIKGKHHTEETKRKIGLGHKGKPNHREGIHLSEETKKKMRKANPAKLTQGQAEEIRSKYATGNYSYHSLAEEYFVGDTTIARIIKFQDAYKIA